MTVRAGAELTMSKNLRQDEQGTAAIEFAIISPVLFMLLLAIFEFASAYFAQQVMENVSYNISRTGKTGFVAPGQTQEQTILAMLTNRLDGLIDPETIAMETRTYSEFSDVNQNEPFVDANGNGVRDDGENYTDLNANGEYDGVLSIGDFGEGGQITVYEITVPWRVMTPILGQLVGEDGTINLSSHIIVRNEPYDADDPNP